MGLGRLRASHADRDQVIDTLKHGFVQGRLTKDEFDARAGYALAARTLADLAALTADLPAGPARAPSRPHPRPRRPANPAVRRGARVVAATTAMTGSVWAGALITNTGNQVVGVLVTSLTFVWLGILILVGAIVLQSRRHPA